MRFGAAPLLVHVPAQALNHPFTYSCRPTSSDSICDAATIVPKGHWVRGGACVWRLRKCSPVCCSCDRLKEPPLQVLTARVHLAIRTLPRRRPCVIYCHCNSGSRRDAEEALQVLLPHHITVMCLDFAVSLHSPLNAVAKPPAVGGECDTRAGSTYVRWASADGAYQVCCGCVHCS